MYLLPIQEPFYDEDVATDFLKIAEKVLYQDKNILMMDAKKRIADRLAEGFFLIETIDYGLNKETHEFLVEFKFLKISLKP